MPRWSRGSSRPTSRSACRTLAPSRLATRQRRWPSRSPATPHALPSWWPTTRSPPTDYVPEGWVGITPAMTPTTIEPTVPAALIRALEERAFNAWPARQTVFHRGWVFRLSGGYTKRANSVNALLPGAPFDGVREAAAVLYARHGLPAVFRISPLAPPPADPALGTALLHGAAGAGAASAYLQVRAQNTPALGLYQSMGFKTAYGYHYRVPG